MHLTLRGKVRRLINSVLIVSFASTCAQASAQGCDLLLRDGVFNTFSHTSGSYDNATWHQAWCSGTLKQTSSSGSTGVSLDVVVQSIPIGLGFNDAQQFQTMYKTQFCGAVDRTNVDFKNDSAFQKTADPSLMSAYNQCKKVESKGLETEFTESPNHQVFTVTMRYIPAFVAAGGAKPRLKSISFAPATGVTCTGTIKPPMLLDENSNSLQCQRKATANVSVLINTDVGAFSRDLPPVTPPPTDQEKVMGAMPQGTILIWAAKKPVPAGWHLCNGEAGTVDLTGRAPVGVVATKSVGDKDGEAEHSHTGTGTASSNISRQAHVWSPGHNFQAEGPDTADHSHPVTITTDTKPNLPPSTYVQFIMKL